MTIREQIITLTENNINNVIDDVTKRFCLKRDTVDWDNDIKLDAINDMLVEYLLDYVNTNK